MIATVHLCTPAGEQLLRVEGNDFHPFVTLTVQKYFVHLTRDQARMAGEALRAVALTKVDEHFDERRDSSWSRRRANESANRAD